MGETHKAILQAGLTQELVKGYVGASNGKDSIRQTGSGRAPPQPILTLKAVLFIVLLFTYTCILFTDMFTALMVCCDSEQREETTFQVAELLLREDRAKMTFPYAAKHLTSLYCYF